MIVLIGHAIEAVVILAFLCLVVYAGAILATVWRHRNDRNDT
jgi:hypothetical protein